MTEDESNRIREACFKLSSQVNWTKTTNSESIIEQVEQISEMTEKVFESTIDCLSANIPLGCNTEMIIRAVDYITNIHAIPVAGCDIDWFRITLHTLIELACPNYEIGNLDEDFIEIDLRKRVEQK